MASSPRTTEDLCSVLFLACLLGLGDLPSILKCSLHDLYLLAGALFKNNVGDLQKKFKHLGE